MTALAEAYMERFGFMNITITGGGSGVGASNTLNGTFDIGMCSRDLKQSEIDKGLVPKLIGVDGVVIIVNGVGLTNLTVEQIAGIYSGEITNWGQIGGIDKPIAVISREDGSGTRECFENGLEAYDGDWTLKTEVVKLNSTGAMINQVNLVVGAIGYISIGKLSGI
jgi:phosphate transport system substrate-binding protein